MSADSAGTFGGLAVFLACVIAIAGVTCAMLRVRRIVAVAVLLAAVLPFGVGLLGKVSAEIDHYRTIETLRAPTPDELNAVGQKGNTSLVLGLVGSCLSLLTGVVALVRSTREEPAHGASGDFQTDED